MDDLTREFLIESQEGLDRMERCLTDLEERPQDSALLAEIFRSVHTIKGTTGFLGFKRLERLAHSGENLLGLLRDDKLSASSSVITVLLQLLDGLRTILKTIEVEGNEDDGDDAALIARLDALRAPAAKPTKAEKPCSTSGRARRPASARRSAQAAAQAPSSGAPGPAIDVEQVSPQPLEPVSCLQELPRQSWRRPHSSLRQAKGRPLEQQRLPMLPNRGCR